MHVGNNRTSFLMDKALPAQSMKAMNDKRDKPRFPNPGKVAAGSAPEYRETLSIPST
jgi:hypothetical protein